MVAGLQLTILLTRAASSGLVGFGCPAGSERVETAAAIALVVKTRRWLQVMLGFQIQL